jgi:hypothetical protein
MYTSFDEVEAALALPGKIEHISCMNMLKDYKMKTDKGGIEEYYRNRPSLLEQEATNLVKKP